jgi:hypothetical protein
MTALKVWNGTAWETVTGSTGQMVWDTDWIIPMLSGTYGRSSTAISAGEKPFAYRRNGGATYIRGYVDQGFNAGVPLFTLPVGYRPVVVTPLVVTTGGGTPNMEVRPNGDVVWTGGGTSFLKVADQSFWGGEVVSGVSGVVLGSPLVLNRQRIWCTAGAYRTAGFVGTTTYHVPEITATLGNPSLVLTIPALSVPFFLEAEHLNGLVKKEDAAFHNVYVGLRLTPADEDGISLVKAVTTQNSSVNQFVAVLARKTFRCKANQVYTLEAIIGGGSGGTWNYFKDSNCNLEAVAMAA